MGRYTDASFSVTELPPAAIQTATQTRKLQNMPRIKALKGAKEGDIVEVETPAGTLQYKVIKIHK